MRSRTAAVGFFDGVHLGHRSILRGADLAVTFINHPSTVLDPSRAPLLLTSPEEKMRLIRECGAGEVTALEFTRDLADMQAEDFLDFLPGVAEIRCGPDWRFGRDGKGDADFLRARGYKVAVCEPVFFEGERISSTLIRRVLAAGDIGGAAAMLGRNWSIAGRVGKGKGLGSKIGFPTVNVPVDTALAIPPAGVWAVSVDGAGAIANLGFAPTMGGNAWKTPVLEIHFPGKIPRLYYDGDLVRVEFLRFVRPEIKFDSVEALVRQIRDDCRCCG